MQPYRATYLVYSHTRLPFFEGIDDMIWLYERGAEVLRIETRFDNDSSQFELTWHRPDGTSTAERFPTEDAFRARLESVEAALKTEHWNRSGSPQVLREGWKDGQ